jgi:hypothetical protein
VYANDSFGELEFFFLAFGSEFGAERTGLEWMGVEWMYIYCMRNLLTCLYVYLSSRSVLLWSRCDEYDEMGWDEMR